MKLKSTGRDRLNDVGIQVHKESGDITGIHLTILNTGKKVVCTLGGDLESNSPVFSICEDDGLIVYEKIVGILEGVLRFYEYIKEQGNDDIGLERTITFARNYPNYFTSVLTTENFFKNLYKILSSDFSVDEIIKRIDAILKLEVSGRGYLGGHPRIFFGKLANIVTYTGSDFDQRLDICKRIKEEKGYILGDDVFFIFRGRSVNHIDFSKRDISEFFKDSLELYTSIPGDFTPYSNNYSYAKKLSFRYFFQHYEIIEGEKSKKQKISNDFGDMFSNDQWSLLIHDVWVISDTLKGILDCIKEYTFEQNIEFDTFADLLRWTSGFTRQKIIDWGKGDSFDSIISNDVKKTLSKKLCNCQTEPEEKDRKEKISKILKPLENMLSKQQVEKIIEEGKSVGGVNLAVKLFREKYELLNGDFKGAAIGILHLDQLFGSRLSGLHIGKKTNSVDADTITDDEFVSIFTTHGNIDEIPF